MLLVVLYLLVRRDGFASALPLKVLKQAVSLDQIQYRYPNAPQPELRKLSLTTPAKSTVGLAGATGSGKTTTVDLILGLLEAQEGTLKVDGQAITEQNLRAWQRAIGYVPQQIYLADDTVAANIAFGLDAKDIDQAAVERASRAGSASASALPARDTIICRCRFWMEPPVRWTSSPNRR